MGSLRLTLCTAVLAVAALGPAAHAADGGSVTVTPASPLRGADVSLRVSGCTGTEATAVSPAFVADARLAGTQGGLAGETRIRSSLAPGAYPVSISCSDRTVTGRVTVVDDAGAGQAEQSTEQSTGPSSVSASPVAPVDAGGGGTAHFATVATSGSGPGALQAVTGLTLAGIAAVAVGLRARRSRDPR
ncbi:hypothetical protein GCM10010503_09940 [Streptomyces lucensis JCM 4490]|uniref:Secreted protein n=1 Tax=Streptomyces lucensis JCM 4490 TaxID=1306176 RepID=A0A918IWI1_9ACTN|nr:hypothetical protein [Streptomyces lucensis]GGW36093.1 hypothetical protein GCM10010503_09940 [Streptomyces lucensis JCM 4490]